MKLLGLTLLAGLAVSAVVATPASAQRHVEVERHTTRTTTRGADVHIDRHVRRHKVCRTRWVHHRKVTRCSWR